MTDSAGLPDGGTPRPSRSKLVLSFVIGSFVGVWIAFPVLKPLFTDFMAGQSLGSIGRTLAVGVLLMVIVSLGMVVLFQLFMFMDY